MILDIGRTAVQVTQSFGQVVRDQLNQEILCIVVNVRRVLDSSLEDILVDLNGRATVPEWRETAQHFEDQDTKRPPGRRELQSQ